LPGSGSGRLGLDPRRPPPAPRARSGAPYLVPAAAALLAALALGLGWRRVAACGAASLGGPEAEIRAALAAQDRAHLNDVYGFRAGGTVELHALRFLDVAVAAERDRATVSAMLEATGRAAWRDERADVSYIGRERFGMHPCRIALWCGEGDQFERLRGVLLALFRRHDARHAGAASLAPLVSPAYRDGAEDRPALLARVEREPGAGRARVRAWQIRVEREAAEVGEDLEVDGAGPRRSVYRLAREGGRWLFVSGL
jgi:hypothetical protein